LEELSLVHLAEDGSATVHRWTAEGLARLADPAEHRARFIRAGRYRWWRVEAESHSLEDAVEALRSFLVGQDFDTAADEALDCLHALRRFGQTIGSAALAAEVLETLPQSHRSFAQIADEEARAHLALGFTDRALRRQQSLLDRYQRLAAAAPDRADYQRDLSVSYERMGDLYGALSQGRQARDAYAQSLVIRERLVSAEPDRTDYQRYLAASYQRIGDLYHAVGQSDQARAAYAQVLYIAQRLAAAEPDRADYQRDLIVAHVKISESDESVAVEQLRRALSIAARMGERGQLAPVDEWMIEDLQNRLRQLGVEP
jgi:tetratricopeptide (TPR) repeat protein